MTDAEYLATLENLATDAASVQVEAAKRGHSELTGAAALLVLRVVTQVEKGQSDD